MGLIARLHFADSDYSSEEIYLSAREFDEAFDEVADMIHASSILTVEKEEGFWGLKYTRSINMTHVVKFEIFKS